MYLEPSRESDLTALIESGAPVPQAAIDARASRRLSGFVWT